MNMNSDNVVKNIESEAINRILVDLCSNDTELYLVGGSIRDIILDRPSYDRDYTIIGEKACDYAKKVAEFFQAYYVVLDRDFDIARVIMPDKKNTLDFAGCVKQDIYEDLARRDYTINAIAYRIDGMESGLIDPFNGLKDIDNRIVRAISENNLIDDPLRLLRAFRFAAQLNFSIEDETLNYIKNHKNLINKVAAERINVELIKLFESRHSADNLLLMKEIEFLDEIIPEIYIQRKIPPNLHHHLGLLDHSIETIRQIEINIPDMPEWFRERLEQEPAVNIKFLSLLKVAGLFHDMGKPSTWQIDELGRHRFIKHEEVGAEMAIEVLRRLKFSKNSIKYITTLIKYHLYPSQLLRNEEELTEKAMMRMFRRIGEATPDVILIAMADRLSARGPEITEDIINKNIKGLYWLLSKYKETLDTVQSLPKLLSGNEVMEIVNLPRGPKIGRILKALREAQISGDINTKEEAINFVKGYQFGEKNHD